MALAKVDMPVNKETKPGENDAIIFGKRDHFVKESYDERSFFFCRAWRTYLESERMINSEDLWLAIMFMGSSIAMTPEL